MPPNLQKTNSDKVVVHIVRIGVPLCRWSKDPPREWAWPHLYVTDAKAEAANCADCMKQKLRNP